MREDWFEKAVIDLDEQHSEGSLTTKEYWREMAELRAELRDAVAEEAARYADEISGGW